jgi:hypothetical protein
MFPPLRARLLTVSDAGAAVGGGDRRIGVSVAVPYGDDVPRS